jgi:uncharacterized repeat protein (TIGR01451 family)
VRKVSFLAVVALAAIGAMMLAGAGSAAKPTAAAATPRAMSTWTGPGVVRQVGARNYAGPNCPGKGWNCTTSMRVLQIATAGGTNTAVCSLPTCSFTQSGSSNSARCSQSSSNPTVVQSCTITQNGAQNYATVNQSITASATSSQSGTQTAVINQGTTTPTTGVNQLQLNQNTNQSIKTGSVQNQTAGGSVVVTQVAAGAGTNYAGITQSQLQKEYARSTVMNQNTGTTITDCDPANDPLDDSTFPSAPEQPNVCAWVSQEAANGTNENHLRQSISEDQNSTGGAQQSQGSSDGGIDAGVHQNISGTGHSLNDANQSKSQTQTVPKGSSSSQSQYDPMSCCGFASQLGGVGNTESINQSSSLSASLPNPFQSVGLIGSTHHDPNDGSCSISQKGSINIDSINETVSYPTCPEFLFVGTSCTSGFTDAGVLDTEPACTTSGPDTTPPGAPESSVTLCVQNLSLSEGCVGSTTAAGGDDTLEYDIGYQNAGTATGHGVTVTDVVPTGVTYVSCVPPAGGTCNFSGPTTHTVTFNLGDVAASDSRSMSFQATADCFFGATATDVAQGQATEENAPASSGSVDVAISDGSTCIG